jgi:hypothetical protein
MVQTPSLYNLVYLIPYAVLFIAVIVLAVVLIRLLLAGTRALNAITAERTLRMDLRLAEDDEPSAGAAQA